MNKIKFKCFGDAYWVQKEFFNLKANQEFVSYQDLLNILIRGEISYEMIIDEPMTVGIYNDIGWRKLNGSELVTDENNSEEFDIWCLTLPNLEKL